LVDMTHLWRQRCSSRIYTHSHWDTFSFSLSLSLSLFLALSVSLPNTHTRTHTYKHTNTHTLTYTLTYTLHSRYTSRTQTRRVKPPVAKQNKTSQTQIQQRQGAEREQQKSALNFWYFALPIPVAASDFVRGGHKVGQVCVCCSALHCVAVCCVAVCCSVLQRVQVLLSTC